MVVILGRVWGVNFLSAMGMYFCQSAQYDPLIYSRCRYGFMFGREASRKELESKITELKLRVAELEQAAQ